MTKFEAAARQAKANQLVNTLLAQAPATCWLANRIAEAPPAFWVTAASVAGCNVPSATTVALVLDLLRADALFSEAVAS